MNEYIKVIKFDELKVPSVPFQIPSSKTYFGIKEMMESELDFLKSTVLSKSSSPVIMYSDMPMKEMAKDPEFPKMDVRYGYDAKKDCIFIKYIILTVLLMR